MGHEGRSGPQGRPRREGAALTAAARVALAAALVSCSIAAAGEGHGLAEERPNVVLIVADDLDVGMLDRALALDLMPNFQHLFHENGVRFSNAFVTNSLCCPSRATLLKGQYPHNHGTLTNFPPDGGVGVFDDSSTLATWLREAGYRTGYVGKYLNGYGLIDVDGDGRLGRGDAAYVPPGWDDWQALLDASTYRVYHYFINDNGERIHYGTREEDYQTDVLARRAVEFVADSDAIADDSPFFLLVTPLAPHLEVFLATSRNDFGDAWEWTIRPAPRHEGSVRVLPPHPPSFNEADLGDKPPWLQTRPALTARDYVLLVRQYRNRLESLRAVDDLILEIVEELERADELDRTLLIFTSDNGFLHGEHRLPQKRYPYQESIRVPLYVYSPEVPARRTIDSLVLNNDLAPTIADLAGAEIPRFVDGSSFLPLLETTTPVPWRKRFLIEHFGLTDSVFEVPTYAAIHTGRDDRLLPDLVYTAYEDDAESRELYDLAADPFELESLHRDSSALRRLQIGLLDRWLRRFRDCRGGSCRELEFR